MIYKILWTFFRVKSKNEQKGYAFLIFQTHLMAHCTARLKSVYSWIWIIIKSNEHNYFRLYCLYSDRRYVICLSFWHTKFWILIFYPLKDVYIHRDIEAASLENSLTSGPQLELIYRCYKYMFLVNTLVPIHDIQSMSSTINWIDLIDKDTYIEGNVHI